jgi:glycosyltransferase involved in cell wall biosynthesis
MVSVIIATYNCAQYIEKALKSIFEQNLPRQYYEIVVINDGSTDNTLDILKRYRGEVRLINQPNRGFVAAYNRAIEEAEGNYILRLDADDYLHTDLLSKTQKVLESRPEYYWVYTDRYEIYTSTNSEVRISVGKANVFDMIGCGILFRREVFDKVGVYRELLFEEYDMVLRLIENGLEGYYLPEPLYYYVKHESGMTSQQNYWRDGWKQLVDVWGEDKLRKYIEIQSRLKGNSIFPVV